MLQIQEVGDDVERLYASLMQVLYMFDVTATLC